MEVSIDLATKQVKSWKLKGGEGLAMGWHPGTVAAPGPDWGEQPGHQIAGSHLDLQTGVLIVSILIVSSKF